MVVTLGDYVDGGIDSAGVIERLIRLSTECRLVPLRGNHQRSAYDCIFTKQGRDAWTWSYKDENDDGTFAPCRV